MDPVSNCVCTTPPPDEPSAMEITDIQSNIIENNEVFMKNLDRGKFVVSYLSLVWETTLDHIPDNGKKYQKYLQQLNVFYIFLGEFGNLV